jgi:hypothetical protein
MGKREMLSNEAVVMELDCFRVQSLSITTEKQLSSSSITQYSNWKDKKRSKAQSFERAKKKKKSEH